MGLSDTVGGAYDMACFHPLLGIPDGILPSGKSHYSIRPYSDSLKNDPIHGKSAVIIPCGKCIGCRLEYSRQWANRCMMELEYHDSAYFVTLTYDDLHVPRSYYPDPATGEAMPSQTLKKRDLQLFMKRLRKSHPDDKIRFFACGEYGGVTHRPHYHLIIYGLHLDDLSLYRSVQKSELDISYNYYNSISLQNAWSVVQYNQDKEMVRSPLGFAVLGKVTWETCAYTARYIVKKLNGPDSQFYIDFNLEPPFTVMSRKPGIGRQWYDDHPGIYDYDFINLKTDSGGRKIRPPKYFDRLFDLENPDLASERSDIKKRFSEVQRDLKMASTNMSYSELLASQERALKNRAKILKRSL